MCCPLPDWMNPLFISFCQIISMRDWRSLLFWTITCTIEHFLRAQISTSNSCQKSIAFKVAQSAVFHQQPPHQDDLHDDDEGDRWAVGAVHLGVAEVKRGRGQRSTTMLSGCALVGVFLLMCYTLVCVLRTLYTLYTLRYPLVCLFTV